MDEKFIFDVSEEEEDGGRKSEPPATSLSPQNKSLMFIVTYWLSSVALRIRCAWFSRKQRSNLL
jgi:hypothetical protein